QTVADEGPGAAVHRAACPRSRFAVTCAVDLPGADCGWQRGCGGAGASPIASRDVSNTRQRYDTTYAVGVCREVWRDRLPSGCPSNIAPFWPVSATFVAETGQKGETSGRLHRPEPPPRKSWI